MFFSKKTKPKSKSLPAALEIQNLPNLITNPTPVILEIGCNDGSNTNELFTAFPNAEIYAFEPDPRAQARFLDNVIKTPKIQLLKKAISAKNGFIDFHMSDGNPDQSWQEKLPQGWDLSGSIRAPKQHISKHPWCKFEKTISVETQTLDSFCQEYNISQIDFIWADVQGAEIDLIKGGIESLSHTDYFYTEYNNEELYEGQITLEEILEMLPNFTVHTLFKNDVLLERKKG